ncbi:hypothetical protein PR003_g14698 [Phytophthora rubi]|uniref:Uncharacterized protein n=1 Tax=Phytophthora rubi TaxID=129364 RepID=A0A6A3L301_9STRA|nr:hypothetical protein PR002_g14819 [Phytophthora rubi]KAE9332072.1 hypothetical protein PR003_g14698 [Phytophthora rubi]
MAEELTQKPTEEMAGELTQKLGAEDFGLELLEKLKMEMTHEPAVQEELAVQELSGRDLVPMPALDLTALAGAPSCCARLGGTQDYWRIVWRCATDPFVC